MDTERGTAATVGTVQTAVEFDSGLGPIGRPVSVRGWVKGPADPAARTGIVLYCLAGGGCSTNYFDTHVPGFEGYSMADHLVARGTIVLAVDHPGIGASDPVGDLFSLTPTIVAGAHCQVVEQVRDRLASGALLPGYPPVDGAFVIGVGHSMGGLLAAVVQAQHGSFDALALLGHGSGLPDQLTADELAVSGAQLGEVEGRIEALARRRFDPANRAARRPLQKGAFFTASVPTEVRAEFAATSVPLLYTCGLTSMIPGATRSERARIDVPTFFGFGDHDLIDDYLDCVAQFRSLRDATVFVLEDSGHCHNQASGRRLLWDRIHDWTAIVGR
jgi:pimeloyl-ACP methyl ester carboxylesterase